MTLPADIRNQLAAGKLLAVRAEPYLAEALHSLTVSQADGSGQVGADRTWRLYADPAVCAGWTAQQWASVLRAETRRLLLDHPARADRMAADDPDDGDLRRRFSQASDAVVNSDTARAADTDWPRPALRTEDIPGGRAGMPVELVVALLDAQDVPACQRQHGSASDGEPRPWEQPDPADDQQSVGETRAQQLRQSVAAKIDEHARDGGRTSPGLSAWASETLRPARDWRRVLDSHVRNLTGRVAGRRDYTFTRPSRRRAPLGAGGRAVLPGMDAPAAPRVVVVRDTSGSMTQGENLIAQATAEVEQMLKSRARVTLIDTDAIAHGAVAVRSRSDARQTVGGGGTDMGEGLDAAAKIRPRPHLVVCLTDGDTPWPQRNPLRGTTILICLLGERAQRNAERVPSWAQTLVLD